jgi:hypothetical protein
MTKPDLSYEALDALDARLRRIEWGVTGEPCADGNVDETAAIEAADTIAALVAGVERFRAQVDRLNFTVLLAHAIEDGAISGDYLARFESALEEMNSTLKGTDDD